MSRRSNSGGTNASRSGGAKADTSSLLLSNHPMENSAEHVQFLQRSLDRNDLEMSAVIELNHTLQILREQIIAHCSELTLLDIGEGILRLAPDSIDRINSTERIVRVVVGKNTDDRHNNNEATSGVVLFGDENQPHSTRQRSGITTLSPTKVKSTNGSKDIRSKRNGSSNLDDDDGDDDDDEKDDNDDMLESPVKKKGEEKGDDISNALLDENDDEEMKEVEEQEEKEDPVKLFYEPYEFEHKYQEELCIDYILRMRLRRRLLSRLVRRLLRIATFMDGNDVSPPIIPTSLLQPNDESNTTMITNTISFPAENHMQTVLQRLDQQQQTLQKVQIRNEDDYYVLSTTGKSEMGTHNCNKLTVPDGTKSSDDQKDDTKPEDDSLITYTLAKAENPDDTASTMSMKNSTLKNESKDELREESVNDNEKDVDAATTHIDFPIKSAHISMEKMSNHDMDNTDDADEKVEQINTESKVDIIQKKIDSSSDVVSSDVISEESTISKRIIPEDEIANFYRQRRQVQIDDNYGTLKECKKVFEKQLDPETGKRIAYTMSNSAEQVEVGTTRKQSTTASKERELDFKRYKEAFLSRIPLQPTYDDLGMEYTLFYGDERRRHALEMQKQIQQQEEKHNQQTEDEVELQSNGINNKKQLTKAKIEAMSDEKNDSDKSNIEIGVKSTDSINDSPNGRSLKEKKTKSVKGVSKSLMSKSDKHDVSPTSAKKCLNKDKTNARKKKETDVENNLEDDNGDDTEIKERNDGQDTSATTPIRNKQTTSYEEFHDPSSKGEDPFLTKTGNEVVGSEYTKVDDDPTDEDAIAGKEEMAANDVTGEKEDEEVSGGDTAANDEVADKQENDDKRPADTAQTDYTEEDAICEKDAATDDDAPIANESNVEENSAILVTAASDVVGDKSEERDNSMLEERSRKQDDDIVHMTNRKSQAHGYDGSEDTESDESPKSEAKVAQNSEHTVLKSELMEVCSDDETIAKDNAQTASGKKMTGKELRVANASPSTKHRDGIKSPATPGTSTKRKLSIEVAENTPTKEIHSTIAKTIRPISLVPIPSFYEQDQKRIKLIHSHLLNVSIQSFAHKKLEDCMVHYNNSLKLSCEILERRQRAQSKQVQVTTELRRMQEANREYLHKVSIAKDQWRKRRFQFEQNRNNLLLPSRHGMYSQGTTYLQRVSTRHDPTGITQHVCATLGDVVDVVSNVGSGRIRLDRFNEQFDAPPDPFISDPKTGESILIVKQRIEKELIREIDLLTPKLRASEDNRIHAWRKMLKMKAEHGIPHDMSTSGAPRYVKVDNNSIKNIPVPVLKLSSAQQLGQVGHRIAPGSPNKLSVARRAVNVPFVSTGESLVHVNPLTPTSDQVSDSKYSAARVKERIASDGTVKPVEPPKKGRDGLYLRPAGRTRKGMEWDAFRGVWIKGD